MRVGLPLLSSGNTQRHAEPKPAPNIGGSVPRAGGWPPAWVISREARVVCLLLCVLMIGLADLDLTLTYATSFGMSEGNPIARAVMGAGSIPLVITFKLATMAIGLGILHRYRRSRSGEWAAWTMLLVMGWLLARWYVYNAGMNEFSTLFTQVAAIEDTSWIVMTQ